MAKKLKIATVIAAVLVAPSVLAEDALKIVPGSVPSRDVYVNQGDLVLEEDGKVTKFIAPQKLMDHGRFEIKINRPKVEENEATPVEVAAASLADRIEARRIMHDANQAYFKGEIAKTWELVAQAEKLDPTYYRVITMKGSLLYKIGSTKLAVEVWMESLAQNPNQPEIAKLIESIVAKTASPNTIAKGVNAAIGKKVSVQ